MPFWGLEYRVASVTVWFLQKREYLLEEWFLRRYYHAVNSYVPIFILFNPPKTIVGSTTHDIVSSY